jgi:hypothetical protein
LREVYFMAEGDGERQSPRKETKWRQQSSCGEEGGAVLTLSKESSVTDQLRIPSQCSAVGLSFVSQSGEGHLNPAKFCAR